MKNFKILFFVFCLFLVKTASAQESKAIADQILANEAKVNELNRLIALYQDSVKLLVSVNQDLNKRKSEAELRELKAEINQTVKATPQAQTKIDTYLKAETDPYSTNLSKLKKGTKLVLVERVVDKPYYKVTYRKKTGFVRFDHIALTGRLSELEMQLGRYINEPSTKSESVSSYASPSPSSSSTRSSSGSYKSSSSCPTVQCSGRTKKGARCKNMTTNCSGRCYLH